MSDSSKILVVEDEEAISELICTTLSLSGLTCIAASNARDAHQKIYNEQPDLVLLDWMLPDMSGIEFARRLRNEEATEELSIIMLTARAQESEKVMGLNAGVDDYITKPFSGKELVARVNALLRRVNAKHRNKTLKAGILQLDPSSQRVLAADEYIQMGPTEYRLLEFFMSHQDRAFSRVQLLDRIWGQNVYVEDRTVDVHIRRLRKALTPSGCEKYIQTVRGTGYRFSTN